MVDGEPPAEVGPKVTNTLGRRRFLAGAGLFLASACAPAASRPAAISAPALPALEADPKNGIWPIQYLRAPANVREAYSWAVAQEQTLRFIPCYCGCGADGHTSNYSCYVRSALGGGRVILDTHGFG
ncbi:MAG TPA: PCYCGC motif-containing (lipo)protein [Candidatus Limnocylindria bacterium]